MNNQFDEVLKARANSESFPLPEGYAERVLETCATLTDAKPRKHPAYRMAWIAAALALFITVPNVSPAAAAAMADIPVLGSIVRVVTFRNYTFDDGVHNAEMSVAELEGGDAAQTVNEQVRVFTEQLMEQFQTQCEDMGQGYDSLNVTSQVVTDSDTWFTLRVDAIETQASGYQFSRFYHIDKVTGQTVVLKDLFREDADYVTTLSDEVRRQMLTQMEEDPENAYSVEEFTSIATTQNFYFAQNGELVLVFDEYTIAPGYMGMPEFTIPTDVYRTVKK